MTGKSHLRDDPSCASSLTGALGDLEYEKEDDNIEVIPLLEKNSGAKRLRLRKWFSRDTFLNKRNASPLDYDDVSVQSHLKAGRTRAYLLAFSLFLNLAIFWLLDSLKDPLFALLLGDDDNTDHSNFEKNQPLAKMVSVASTLILVLSLEQFMKKHAASEAKESSTKPWKSMKTSTSSQLSSINGEGEEENVPAMSMISHVHIPYSILFVLIGLQIKQYPNFDADFDISSSDESTADAIQGELELPTFTDNNHPYLAYLLYVAIESFGSLSVAAFWSYSNSNLDINSAKKYYGFIIAAAQIGAILGSTVATLEFMTIPNMLFFSSALMVCNMLFMVQYHYWYSHPLDDNEIHDHPSDNLYDESDHIAMTSLSNKTLTSLSKMEDDIDIAISKTLIHPQDENSPNNNEDESGLFLILKHKYLLSILAVSCLYEISLTCIDYEMKLVGLERFDLADANSTFSFKTFMGRYGQITNLLSLLLSFYGFPYFMEFFGVRYTLRLFPGFLVVITTLTFTILANNIWLLFISMALLKAMTYSLNDPAKEILYMPTSPTIKVKAKFWIDVVGARFAKALGSSITNYAGSADRLVKVGGVPSVVSSLIFLYFCIRVGDEFEYLVRRKKVVGIGDDDDVFSIINPNDEKSGYSIVPREEEYYNDMYEDEARDDNDYLVSMDPFTYKTDGWGSDPEGSYGSGRKNVT